MLTLFLDAVWVAVGILLCYVSLSTAYLLFLAIAFLVTKDAEGPARTDLHRFAILVPAHDEELVITALCKNLLSLDYPRRLREVFVIADNCTDRTAAICREHGITVLERTDSERRGKGHAMSWAIKQLPLDRFDALLVVDADTRVGAHTLTELNRYLSRGCQVVQCSITIPNRHESWFTELLFVARTINNVFYHWAKEKLGLSAYLMGSGMCLTTKLIGARGWNAFSLSEDWEYYAQLVMDGIRIAFAGRAPVFQIESRKLKQATSQRLRWARGRFAVLWQLGFKLLFRGLRQRSLLAADASLALILPNHSMLANLTLLTLAASLFLPSFALQPVFRVAALSAVAGQAFLLIAGACVAGSYWTFLRAIIRIPLFLCWKLAIDFVSVTGIYRGRSWVRTARSQDTSLAEETAVGEIYGRSSR